MRESTETKGLLTPMNIGIVLTLGVFVLFFYMALQSRCELLTTKALECRSNFAWFMDSPPNEVGDTLSGIAGTLAFLWIIITVMIQGNDLRLQKDELELTRKELQGQREASESMAKAMEQQSETLAAQLKLFDLQREREDQKANGELMIRLLDPIERKITSLSFQESRNERWKRRVEGEFTPSGSKVSAENGIMNFSAVTVESDVRGALGKIISAEWNLRNFIDDFVKVVSNSDIEHSVPEEKFLRQYLDINCDLQQISEILPKLSAAEQQFYKNSKLPSVIESFNSIAQFILTQDKTEKVPS